MADNINTYQGNAALGAGGSGGGEFFVTQPQLTQVNDSVDKMMYYNFLENKDKWARQNVLADEDAKTAAAMSTFPISDWLIPKDKDAAFGAISNFNATFMKDPSAVRLLTDSHGKVLNGPAYFALQEARNKVLWTIGRANARTSKYTAMKALVEAIPINSPARKAAENWLLDQSLQPIEKDLVSYPNTNYFDAKAVVAPTIANTNAIKEGDLLYTIATKFPDINAGINRETLAMDAPDGSGQPGQDYWDLHTKTMRDLVNQIKETYKGKPIQPSDPQIMTDMAQLPGGAVYAQQYNYYYGQKKFIDDNITANKWSDMSRPPEIHVQNLTRNDMIAMHLMTMGEFGTVAKGDELQVPQKREEAQLQHQDKQQEMADLYTTTGSAKASIYTTIAGTVSDTPGQKDADPSDLQLVGKKSLTELIPGYDPNVNTAHTLQFTQPVINVFRKGMAGQTEVISTGDQSMPYITKQKDYQITGGYAIGDKDNDPDNNKYIIFYKPAEGTKGDPTYAVFNNAGLWDAAAHVNDNTGLGGTALSNANDEATRFLRKFKLNDKPSPSQINSRLGNQSYNSAKGILPAPLNADGTANRSQMAGGGQQYIWYDATGKGKIITK